MKSVACGILLLVCMAFSVVHAKEYIFWKYPHSFSDFSMSVYDNVDDLKYLIDEFERYARPAIDATFPEDEYVVFILIEDIDMAGRYAMNTGYELGTTGLDEVRVIENSSSGVLQLQYEIQTVDGRVLTKGKFRKRMQRILPYNFYVGPKKQFPYIVELFDEWLMLAREEAQQSLASL